MPEADRSRNIIRVKKIQGRCSMARVVQTSPAWLHLRVGVVLISVPGIFGCKHGIIEHCMCNPVGEFALALVQRPLPEPPQRRVPYPVDRVTRPTENDDI